MILFDKFQPGTLIGAVDQQAAGIRRRLLQDVTHLPDRQEIAYSAEQLYRAVTQGDQIPTDPVRALGMGVLIGVDAFGIWARQNLVPVTSAVTLLGTLRNVGAAGVYAYEGRAPYTDLQRYGRTGPPESSN